jgi:hypothetical protein
MEFCRAIGRAPGTAFVPNRCGHRAHDCPGGFAAADCGVWRSLISAGLRKGDRVLIGCSLSPSSALVYLGAMYAGLVAVPVEERR